MAWSTVHSQHALLDVYGAAEVRTSRLVQMGQVGQVIAGLEHGRVH